MDHGHRLFYYRSPCLGSVVKVYPIDSARRLYVDVLPLDNRGAMLKVPVFVQAGWVRNMRVGQSVKLHFVDGNPQNPVVLLHAHNSETNPAYADPLPPAGTFDNMDDQVAYHDETGVSMRFRSRWSNASTSLLGPAQVDLQLASGALLQFYEYDPDGYTPGSPQPPAPPPATRAKFTVKTPSGCMIEIDEPEQGQATILIQHPAGTTLRIAADGSVDLNAQDQPITIECATAVITAQEKITLSAPDVELGSDGGQPFLFVTEHNEHIHTDPQGGVTGPPQTPAVGTLQAKAV